MAARDNAAYAERFVAPLVGHVVKDLGLESVRYFNPVNEPMEYGVYQTPEGGPDVHRHYVDMYRQMRLALDRAGVPRAAGAIHDRPRPHPGAAACARAQGPGGAAARAEPIQPDRAPRPGLAGSFTRKASRTS
jgi:hypothetical protein